jgi:hypothetical protein
MFVVVLQVNGRIKWWTHIKDHTLGALAFDTTFLIPICPKNPNKENQTKHR